jgi:hypothetical protein
MPRTLPSLRDLLTDLEHDEPGWFQLAGCEPAVATTRLEEEVDAVVAPPPVPPGSVEITVVDLEPALTACELLAAHLMDLALICYERSPEPEQLLWPGREGPQGTFILTILSTNLANSLLAIRELVIAGFDVQARFILRSFVEIADAAVASAYDYEFFVAFAQAEADPDHAFRYWQKYLKPARVREILDRLSAHQGMPAELRNEVADTRREMYRWLSNYSHIHPLGLALAGLARRVDDRGVLIPKFGRLRDSATRHTLSRAAHNGWLTVLQLGWLLATETHGWYALVKKGDKERSWFSFRKEVITRYILRHYAALMSDEDASHERSAETPTI